LSHPTRVAIDGRTASGKTTFADDLADGLRGSGKEVVRTSVDGFHNPATTRYRQGRLSPDGYYEDARNLDAIRERLLVPLGPGGNRNYVTHSFDLVLDRSVDPESRRAPEGAILIFDGTFLQRPELRSHWDFVIFLDIGRDEARSRGVNRDSAALGGKRRASELYRQRYEPAFARYTSECDPARRADVVINDMRPQG
jgi:uridine kinase